MHVYEAGESGETEVSKQIKIFAFKLECNVKDSKWCLSQRVSNIHNKVAKQESIQIFQVKHAIAQQWSSFSHMSIEWNRSQ